MKPGVQNSYEKYGNGILLDSGAVLPDELSGEFLFPEAGACVFWVRPLQAL